MPFLKRSSSPSQDNNSDTNQNPNANDLEAQRVPLTMVVEAQKSSIVPPTQYGTLSDANGDRGTAAPVVAVLTDSIPESEMDYWPLLLGMVVLGAFAMLLYGGSQSWTG